MSKMSKLKRTACVILALVLTFAFAACSTASSDDLQSSQSTSLQENQDKVAAAQIDEDGQYYDLEHVVLYIDAYDKLPPNFITKSEARSLGWNGGSVENYLEGAAIGGDQFKNREELLPSASGRTYTECDLNTNGAENRGAERLVFSNDGLYFYTGDHYESFYEVYITDKGEVEFK